MSAPEAWLVLLVLTALLHQGLVALLLLTALVLRYGVRQAFWEVPRQRLMVAAALVSSVFWFAVAVNDGPNWIRGGAASFKGATRRTFLGWPDFANSLIEPWATDLPFVGICALVAIVFLLVSRRRTPWNEILRGPVGILVYGILAFGLCSYFREAIRYHFLPYPVVLVTLATASFQLAGIWRGLVIFATAFALSGDFNPSHIAAAGRLEVAFRTGPFLEKEDLWYPRPDYQSAEEFLSRVATGSPDALFVIDYCPPVARHIQVRRYASYLPRSSFAFYEWSRERGTRDVWKGRLLLSTWDELREVSKSDREVFVMRPQSVRSQLEPEDAWGERVEKLMREFVSRDGRIEVLRVSLKL